MSNKVRNPEIEQWLSAPDPSTNYNRALEQRHEGSGSWLLQSEQFIEWKTSERTSTLWLHGPAGCGKTILSSTVIQELERSAGGTNGSIECQPLIYFYFDFSDSRKQTLDNMLRALIMQLCSQHQGASQILESLYSSCRGSQPSSRSLRLAFLRMVGTVKKVWIVLDALDECTTRDGPPSNGLLWWLCELMKQKGRKIHLLATSRLQFDIQYKIMNFARPEDAIGVQNSLITNDINEYIRMRLGSENSGLKRWQSRPEVQSEIETCLMSQANGMFRLVACQLDVLENCLDYRTLRKALKSLPGTLDETYARILRNIPEEYKQGTIRILQFLMHSERPLTIEEAIDIIAIDTEGDEYSFDPKYRMPNSDEILCYCSSLVAGVPGQYSNFENPAKKTNQGFTGLQLAHLSVKEFLASDQIDSNLAQNFERGTAMGSIATVCLAYLLHLDFPIELPFWKFWEAYPFLGYCAEYWLPFAQASGNSNERLQRLVREFLTSHKNSYETCYRFYCIDKPREGERYSSELSKPPTPVPPLYYAAFGGLLDAVEYLISQGAEINLQGRDGGNALVGASAGGHENVVEFLLNHHADVNAQDGGQYGNALYAASATGHLNVVKVLVDKGADVNGPGAGEYCYALSVASARGHKEVVETLLNSGANINAFTKRHEICDTALASAIKEGHEEIVELLIAHGAEVNSCFCGSCGGPLNIASFYERHNIVQLLLNHDTGINATS
ncbi:hypothetical protein TWF481_002076 [Arthrobotrys musiformis]|uniref:NACHT domain-containing protein n=1 Tax=Arthrobotrys musiformis TaxID=47236 RepID=A0AAV9VS58_9PEZI